MVRRPTSRARGSTRGDPGDERSRSPGDGLFWVLVAAVGIGLYFFALRPAQRESERTGKSLRSLQRSIEETRATVLRRELEVQGLESDPFEIERNLRNRGYTKDGQIRLVNAEDADTAPRNSSARAPR